MNNTSRLAIFLLFVLPVCSTWANTVEGLRLGVSADRTRVVLDLAAPLDGAKVSWHHAGDNVLLLVLPGFNLEVGLDELPLQGTAVGEVIASKEQNNVLSLEFILTQAVKPRVFSLPPNAEHGNRLVLDLYTGPESAGETAAAAAIG